MRIITCFKVVPDDQEITVNADRTLNLEKAPASISSYDLNAIEAGVVLAEALADTGVAEDAGVGAAGAAAGTSAGAEVIALSVGGGWIDDSKL
ncbi:MAG: hypothetical protein LBP28_00130, partial [Coriobacteriales bacterium]|nr:hypothetical protein [Coriobacteriales bacterium]